MNPELLQAVKERIALGYQNEKIIEELRAAGYAEETILVVLETAATLPAIPRLGAVPAAVAELPSVTKLLRDSFSFLRQRFDLYLCLALTLLMFVALEYMTHELTAAETHASVILAISTAIGLFAYVLFLFIGTYIVSESNERRVSLKEGMQVAQTRIFDFIWVAILVGLVTLGGFLLLFIPGIILFVALYFAQLVYVKEDVRGLQALQRSRALVAGQWWAVAGRLLGIGLTFFGALALLGIVVGIGFNSDLESGPAQLVFEVLLQLLVAAAIVMNFHITYTLYTHRAAAVPLQADNTPPKGNGYLLVCAVLGVIMTLSLLFASATYTETKNPLLNETEEESFDTTAAKERALELRNVTEEE